MEKIRLTEREFNNIIKEAVDNVLSNPNLEKMQTDNVEQINNFINSLVKRGLISSDFAFYTKQMVLKNGVGMHLYEFFECAACSQYFNKE